MSAAVRPELEVGSARSPLAEVSVLLGLVCAGLALLSWGSPRSPWLFAAALVLACLGGVEAALREHGSGRRSRSGLLGGSLGVAASVAALLAGLSPAGALACAAATVVVACLVLERDFARRRAS